MDNARFLALKLLRDINTKGKFSNLAINEALNSSNLSNLDKSFVTRLVYGTLEKQNLIDRIIEDFTDTRKANPWIKNILRMGTYQIVFLDKIPDSAAINESVNLVRRLKLGSLRAYVNGVLRNISRNKDDISLLQALPEKSEEFEELYDIPRWLAKLWIENYGLKNSQSIVESISRSPFISIRINTKRAEKKNIIHFFESMDIDFEEGIFQNNLLRVKGFKNIGASKLYKDGLITVQGESSMLVCHILDPKPNESVLDACSAPGGKALYISEIMDNKGNILAADVYPHRINLIKLNKKRMGMTSIKEILMDGSIYEEKFEATMDKILIDAPCSGLGVIHKKPDIVRRIDKNKMDVLYELQRKILNNNSRYLKKDGILVYSTCTINPYENEKQIERFLKDNPNFILMGFEEFLPNKLRFVSKDEGMIQIIPDELGLDGFFIAKLMKVGL